MDFSPEPYVAGFPNQIHRVRGAPRDIARAFPQRFPVGVPVVDKFHLLRLSGSQQRPDRENVEYLRIEPRAKGRDKRTTGDARRIAESIDQIDLLFFMQLNHRDKKIK